MKPIFTIADLERIAINSGWASPRLGVACLLNALRGGADVVATVASFRKWQSGMFLPHRRVK